MTSKNSYETFSNDVNFAADCSMNQNKRLFSKVIKLGYAYNKHTKSINVISVS